MHGVLQMYLFFIEELLVPFLMSVGAFLKALFNKNNFF